MYCPNCGKEISDGTRFCPYCGASLLPQTEVVYKPVYPPRDDGAVWKGVVLVLLFGVVGLILVYALCGDQSETKRGAWICLGVVAAISILIPLIILAVVFGFRVWP